MDPKQLPEDAGGYGRFPLKRRKQKKFDYVLLRRLPPTSFPALVEAGE